MTKKIVFVSGLPRCATTSLVSLLAQHPDVTAPMQKEPHFFLPSDYREKLFAFDGTEKRPYAQLGYCRSKKDYFDNLRCHKSCRYYLDGSTLYSTHVRSFIEIAKASDVDPFFILLHRDPLERAFSHYRFSVSRAEECRSFEQALRDERDGRYSNWLLKGYFQASRLSPAVQTIEKEFGASKLQIIDIDHTRVDSADFMNSLCEWLDLERYRFRLKVYDNAVPSIEHPTAQGFRILARRVRQRNPVLFDNAVTRQLFRKSLSLLGQSGGRNQHRAAIQHLDLASEWQVGFDEIRAENCACVDSLENAGRQRPGRI